MGSLQQQALLSGSRLGHGCVCVVALLGLAGTAVAGTRTHAPLSPWDAAVRSRAAFEAEPAGAHTRDEYARVINGFRAVYHGDPGDAHAARAVEQVAELLAEEGRELADRKALQDSAGQYRFLAKAYPSYRAGKRAEGKGEGQAEAVVAASPPPHKQEVSQPRPNLSRPPSVRPASADLTTIVSTSTGPLAMVTGIRHWSTASYTRVAIDLTADDNDTVKYEAVRVQNPDRIFFDLHHARVSPQLEGRTFTVTDDGFLTKVRAAQFSSDVTRVVLDLHEVGEYSAFLLPNPSRLIIDIHGRAGKIEGPAPGVQGSENPAPVVRTAELPTSANSPTSSGSSLPPMPVTDGSAAFGLPAKSGTVSQPRVVVSSRPTVTKPVPNTVTTATADAGSDVAAVSAQPGKVAATRRPTSQPVTDRVQGAGPRVQRGDHDSPRPKVAAATPVVAAAPAEAPPPTADGETSLVRALGLKIGRIVIDAGHGGHDSGTLGVRGIEEKDLVLDVALRLGKLLHDRLGAQIVYTRADDTFIPLETRTAIANKAQADLFISVHANSSPDAGARGVEVYYLNFTSDPDAMKVAGRENAVSTQSVHELSDLVKKIALKDKIDESRELAADVDASLYSGLRKGNDGLKDRGIKKAPFVVLIGANMPSILAEISFVTNPDDADQLQTPAYRERVAESLCKGVERYAAGINGVKSRTVATERAAVK